MNVRTMRYPALLLFLFGALLLPFPAQASAGITEFGGPLETFVNTICGPGGKFIATLAIACVGVYFAMNRAEMTDIAKQGLAVIFAICWIPWAPTVVNKLFSFSGAML